MNVQLINREDIFSHIEDYLGSRKPFARVYVKSTLKAKLKIGTKNNRNPFYIDGGSKNPTFSVYCISSFVAGFGHSYYNAKDNKAERLGLPEPKKTYRSYGVNTKNGLWKIKIKRNEYDRHTVYLRFTTDYQRNNAIYSSQWYYTDNDQPILQSDFELLKPWIKAKPDPKPDDMGHNVVKVENLIAIKMGKIFVPFDVVQNYESLSGMLVPEIFERI